LNSSFTLNASGGTNYIWNGPNSFTSTQTSITLSDVTTNMAGFYVLSGTDSNGCSNEDSLWIEILSLPIIDANASGLNATTCLNALISLNASGANSYSWTGPNNFTSTIQNPFISNANSAQIGWYNVIGTDNENCASSDSVYVNVILNVPANGTPSDSIICPGNSVSLTASGGQSYQWSGPQGFNSTQQNVTLNSMEINQTGWYLVNVTDEYGCYGVDSTYIQVQSNKNCLFIPNLITPDFDHHNDTWVIEGIENFDKAVVQIFNRWGNLIYYSSPYNNDWDGQVNRGATIDGKDGKVPVGTYFYIIELNEGDQPAYKGYIDVQY
jgi:gliding motility-associated-like protein